MHILIVDDEEVIRRGLAHVLEGLGHTTCAADTGEAALSIMRAEKPDVVLLDLALKAGGMSGWSVAREKLLDPDIRSIPVIVVSGLAPAEIRRGGYQPVENVLSGAMVILPKPVDVDALARALHAVETSRG